MPVSNKYQNPEKIAGISPKFSWRSESVVPALYPRINKLDKHVEQENYTYLPLNLRRVLLHKFGSLNF
jgi:hypothetical protein